MPKTETIGMSVESARTAIERLAAKELAEFKCWRGIGVEIEEERASGNPDAHRVTRLETERENAAQAGAAARDRRRAAIIVYFKAQADEMHRPVPELRKEIEHRRRKTDRMLDELDAFEGARYCPVAQVTLAQLQLGVYFDGVEQILRDGIPSWPKTSILITKCDLAEAAAASLAARPVPDSGAVSAGSVDALLAAVLADPCTIAPGLQSIAEWAKTAEQAVRAAHPTAVGVTFSLIWADSAVNTKRSFAQVVESLA